jgi:hypothetical protein
VESESCGQLVRSLVLVVIALWGVLLAGQSGAPPIPPWPSDNKPPRNPQGNYIFLDQTASTIVVVIPGALTGEPDQSAQIIRLPFHNRFDPEVSVSIAKTEPDRYRYVYSLANGKAAEDAVTSWKIALSCDDPQFSIDSRPIGWHCTETHGAGLHQFALPYVSGSTCAVVCFLDGPQAPNSASARLTILSGVRPGFTTASAENYPTFQVPQDWPEVIRYSSQLSTLGDFAWSDKHTVTLGPRFSAGVSASAMATDFLQGLAELVSSRRLAGDSEFLKQLRADLTQAAQTGHLGNATLGNASTDLEREIAEAVKLSFGQAGAQPTEGNRPPRAPR